MLRSISSVAITGVLLACILAVQALRLPTPIAGIMVNGILIFSILQIGTSHGAVLAVLSPIGAFLTGTLAAPLYPLIPVILLGNLFYVFLYGGVLKKSRIVRLLMPALVKGLFMAGAGFTLVKYLAIGEKVKWLLIPVLGLQTVTAVLGTLVAEVAQPPSSSPTIVD